MSSGRLHPNHLQMPCADFLLFLFGRRNRRAKPEPHLQGTDSFGGNHHRHSVFSSAPASLHQFPRPKIRPIQKTDFLQQEILLHHFPSRLSLFRRNLKHPLLQSVSDFHHRGLIRRCLPHRRFPLHSLQSLFSRLFLEELGSRGQ